MTKIRFDANRRKLLLAGGISLLPIGLMSCGGGGGSGGGSGGGASSSSSSSSSTVPPTVNGTAIVIDQFGYLPALAKIAVIRDPKTGFDASASYTPGTVYDIVDTSSNAVVYSGTPVAWNGGATDTSSGDIVWHFDFSTVTTAGTYFVRDTQKNVRSNTFQIGTNVYGPVLRAAVRYFFYQRAGQVKTAANAGAGWADGASQVGPGQDTMARLYSSPNDATTQRDLSGGWYDAGDQNKYTDWAAGYIIDLLHAYTDNPGIWGDDFNIPESGNGIPDILDEVKWGLDWLSKMQNADGSVLSIVGVSSASPPSSATGPSYYGPASTSATIASAGAYAYGAKVLATIPALATYAAGLLTRAQSAWTWAVANPEVLFQNNVASNNSTGLGAGQQETDDYGRLTYKLIAAIHLFDLTGNATYSSFVDSNYTQAHMFAYSNFVYPYEASLQSALLYYASLPAATAATATAIKNSYVTGMNSSDNWGAVTNSTDPYLAYLGTYVWGSNGIKADQGEMFAAMPAYGIGSQTTTAAMNAASHYIHYLHGVNPLGKVYLSNMGSLGAANSVDQFYNSWFCNGSALWSSVKSSTYGPAPGYLVGGPNPSYTWDSGCPTVSSLCGSAMPSPPAGQPAQKSYKDFNDSWPLDSWSVTENSNGYQTAYIRLLARFVSQSI